MSSSRACTASEGTDSRPALDMDALHQPSYSFQADDSASRRKGLYEERSFLFSRTGFDEPRLNIPSGSYFSDGFDQASTSRLKRNKEKGDTMSRQLSMPFSAADMYCTPSGQSNGYQNPNAEYVLGRPQDDYKLLSQQLASAFVLDGDSPSQELPSSSSSSSIPPTVSDKSARSSSEALHDEEIKTPPEHMGMVSGRHDLPRLDLYKALSAYQGIKDVPESLELLDDGLMQTRPAGKARMAENDPLAVVSRPRPASMSWSIRSTPAQPEKPFSRLSLQSIAFEASTLPSRQRSSTEYVDIITRKFPMLCEHPAREIGEDGQPLPPTKRHETSDAERAARKLSMTANPYGKQRLSLVKAMVVMESRSATWKRIGNVSIAQSEHTEARRSSSTELPRLVETPSPWAMEIRHEDLMSSLVKNKNKKTLELTSLRKNALCPVCDGQRLFCCVTCKGEKADECFWCSGTGREKSRAKASCRRCHGVGTLKCNTCEGTLKSACQACEGQGNGEYGFFVDIRIKRVDMPAVPMADLLPLHDETSGPPPLEVVKAAATTALWDSIMNMTESANNSPKAKAKATVPVMAGCVWETSVSDIIAIDVPLSARIRRGSAQTLRPEGIARKIATETRYFAVPSDADVEAVEISAQEASRLAQPAPSTPAISTAHKEFVSRPSPLSQQMTASFSHNDRLSDQQSSDATDLKHARRQSAGAILHTKLSSNLLRSKLHRS